MSRARRLMVRDLVTAPWGDVGTVIQVHPSVVFVKWHRSGGEAPEPIDRALVRIRSVGRPRKIAAR